MADLPVCQYLVRIHFINHSLRVRLMRETERVRRRDLPHWDVPGATYFVTACLAGSIPATGLLDIRNYQQRLKSSVRPTSLSNEEWKVRCWKLTFARIHQWLDQASAIRHLEDARLAQIVASSLLHFAGERYEAFRWL